MPRVLFLGVVGSIEQIREKAAEQNLSNYPTTWPIKHLCLLWSLYKSYIDLVNHLRTQATGVEARLQ